MAVGVTFAAGGEIRAGGGHDSAGVPEEQLRQAAGHVGEQHVDSVLHSAPGYWSSVPLSQARGSSLACRRASWRAVSAWARRSRDGRSSR